VKTPPCGPNFSRIAPSRNLPHPPFRGGSPLRSRGLFFHPPYLDRASVKNLRYARLYMHVGQT
jgi:hypothetical protein